MFKELLTIFRSEETLKSVGDNFSEMLQQCLELVRRGGVVFFRHAKITADEHEDIRKQDVRVNKLERRIRKQVLVHLSVDAAGPDLPYCLLMISLVKDVERIGDLAKDLVNVVALTADPLPDDELVHQLDEIRAQAEGDFQIACDVIQSADRARAVTLIREGRAVVERCDALIHNIAHSQHRAGVTSTLILAARIYQRIAGHVLNLLSSVVMPLHKLDYYDEDDIAKASARLGEKEIAEDAARPDS